MFGFLSIMGRVRDFILPSRQQISLQEFHGRCWQVTQYSWFRDKDFITSSTASSMNFIIPPDTLWITWMDTPRTHSWFVSQLRNLEFRKSESFIMNTKQICMNFVMESAIILIILDGRQTCLLFLWETLTLSSQAVYYGAASISALSIYRNETHRDLAPNVPLMR